MAEKTSLVSGIAIGAAIAAGAWYGVTHVQLPGFVGSAEASAVAAASFTPTVRVFTTKAQNISAWEEFTGRFEAVEDVAIQARVSGHLQAVHFEPGELVEKGDLLFTIDPRPFQAALAEARAELAQSQAAARLADLELERAKQLAAQGHISQAMFDSRQQDHLVAQARSASAHAAVERAELDLEFTEIHAPVSGRISDNFVSAGNLIAAGAGSTVLTTIVSLDPIHFVFDVTEQQYLEYVSATGAPVFRETASTRAVTLDVAGSTQAQHSGHIDFIDNQMDHGTGTLRGRAIFDNAQQTLLPGMFGRIKMEKDTAVGRIGIPDLAIGSDQATKFVFVVGEDGTVERRDVTLFDQHEGLRIVEGLAANEQIVVSGLQMIGAGARVAVAHDTSDTNEIAMR